LGDADSQPEIVTLAAPALGEVVDPAPHRHRHPHRTLRRVVARDRVVEEHHDPVTREPFQRAVVRVDQRPDGPVMLAEHAHHLFGLTGLRERREVPEIGEYHHDLAAMTAEQVLVTDHQIGQLWRQEVAQPAGAFQLLELRGDAGLELRVPRGELVGLPPDGVVVPLDAGQ
jgi:hypothetical protein